VFTPLLPDRFVVAAAPGDPLASAAPRPWSGLQARAWILSSIHTQARTRFESLCADWPQPPDFFPVVTRVLPVSAHLIRQHRLLGVMPLSFVRPLLEAGELVQLPVDADLSMAPLGLMTPATGARLSAQRLGGFLRAAQGEI
jgi:DNA-binding transcriptional LysR family regulator